MTPAPLAPAPAQLIDPAGRVTAGRYEGLTGDIDWQLLRGATARGHWWRRFHHKRWLYVALSGEHYFGALAMVHLGWTSTAFGYVFDRRARAVVAAFSQYALPGFGARLADRLGSGAQHQFRWPGVQISCAHVDQRAAHQLALRSPGFAIDAEWPDTAPVLLAVGPVAGGALHATQKTPASPLRGELRLGAIRVALDGASASMDYSNGLLARDTAWRWASAHRADIGFNLQAGYFGAQENALWLDGALIALGAAHFAFDGSNPMAPWQVRTDDGLLELVFTPEGLRREDKNLGVAASRYVQPIGVFRGWVRANSSAPRRDVSGLVGVTEDHQSRW